MPVWILSSFPKLALRHEAREIGACASPAFENICSSSLNRTSLRWRIYPYMPDTSNIRPDALSALLLDGIRYERGGVVTRAQECFEAVTRQAADHPAIAAEAWWRLANLHRLHSSWDESLIAAHRSAELAREHGLADIEADALNIEGAVWYVRGDFDRARPLYTRSLELATSPATRAKALQNLGALAAEERNFEEGERLFARSREAYRVAGDARGEAVSLLNIGRLQSDRGFPAVARATLEAAVVAARLTGDFEMHAAALLNLGIALSALGLSNEAEERITTAYGQFTIADIPAQRVRCLMQLATLSVTRGEASAAVVCLTHARVVAASAGLPRELRLIDEQMQALLL
jgi:tetratricopeptide (TPR) repeat protein